MDTFTALLRLVLQETGGNQNVWGDINNSSLIDLVEDAIAGREDVDVTLSDQTLVGANGADDPARAAILICSGNPGATREVIVPSTSKLYVVTNETSPAFDVTIKTALGTGIAVTDGQKILVFVDATLDDVVAVGAVPKATETVEGKAEIADQAEVDAGTDDERFVTPLKLATFPAVNQATETVKGIAELADQTETDLGVDDERIITPLKLETRQSSVTLTGLARRATQLEVDTGTEVAAFVTPETLNLTPISPTFRGCKAFQSSFIDWPRDDAPNLTFTGPTNAADEVAYNNNVYDTDSIHSTSVDNERFTPPVGTSRIRINVAFNPMRGLGAGTTGLKHALIRLNGSTTGTIDSGYTSWIPLFTQAEPSGTNGSEWGWAGYSTGIINVSGNGTDYFSCWILTQAGEQRTQANGAFFEMEIVE